MSYGQIRKGQTEVNCSLLSEHCQLAVHFKDALPRRNNDWDAARVIEISIDIKPFIIYALKNYYMINELLYKYMYLIARVIIFFIYREILIKTKH